MRFSKDTSAGYLVNDLARRFAAALQARIKPLGLSTGVFPVMVQLWEDDGLTQTELVRVSASHRPHVHKFLHEVARRLLEEGMTPDDSDAWSGMAKYLDGRVQGSPEQKPGRTPDMSAAAAAAMITALRSLVVGDERSKPRRNSVSKTIGGFFGMK